MRYRGPFPITVFGREIQLDHGLGLGGDLFFNCKERASLKYFENALPIFFPEANKKIGLNIKGLPRKHKLCSMFLDLAYYSIRQDLPSRFAIWLKARNVAVESAELWHDSLFYVLLVNKKINLVWSRTEFEANWNELQRYARHGAYTLQGSTLEVTLKDAQYVGSFQVRIIPD